MNTVNNCSFPCFPTGQTYQVGAVEWRGDPHQEKKKPKTILLWNSFWGVKGWEVGLGSAPFHRLNCPVRSCEITQDRSLLNQSDAVLFHIHELEGDPPQKYPNQRWVFFQMESPGYSHNYLFRQWKAMFNWTMTYRLDSDIPLYYGYIHTKKKIKKRRSRRIPRKSKLVAWMVSNCGTQSKRDKYVEELQKYVPVDIYGRCGNLTCPRNYTSGGSECLSMINSTYKFYLSFENSICKDYVTEKLFMVLPLDVVPIVRSGADYSKLVPRRWYINTKDYESPLELAYYLKFLDRHPEEYMKYFAGRHRYNMGGYYGPSKLPSWCRLCEKLNDETEPVKVYHKMEDWWKPNDCQAPSDFKSTLHN